MANLGSCGLMTLILMQDGNLIHQMWWISEILPGGGDNKSGRDSPECSSFQESNTFSVALFGKP